MNRGLITKLFFPIFIFSLLLSFTSLAGFKLKPATHPVESNYVRVSVGTNTVKDVIKYKLSGLVSRFMPVESGRVGKGDKSGYGIAAGTLGILGILLFIVGAVAVLPTLLLFGVLFGIIALPIGIVGCIGKKKMKGLAVFGIIAGALSLAFLVLLAAALASFT